MDSDWDLAKYKQDHEIDEHWELKKKFLMAHKDKYPEDQLVCLAQVFVNVELLGCRYPTETMKLVAELSREVAEDYRNKRKTKLQRTFVQASDAASSKVKGLKNTPNTSINQSQSSIEDISPEENKEDTSDIEEIPCKQVKSEPEEKSRIIEVIDLSDNDDDDDEEISMIETKQPYGKLVLFEHPGEPPQNILQRVVSTYGLRLDWKKTTEFNLAIYINNKLVGTSNLSNKKQARAEAAASAVNELRKHYYTIKVKHTINPKAEKISCSDLKTTPEHDSIIDNNIGNKLMKLMGWTGGGLGKTQQGIVNPVSVDHQLSRQGLGLHSQKADLMKLKKKCRQLINNGLKNGLQDEIVFSSDFTKEERAAMHNVAKQMGIKSCSYGSGNNRTLTFSRKIDPEELVTELKSVGGNTEKYELIEPTQ